HVQRCRAADGGSVCLCRADGAADGLGSAPGAAMAAGAVRAGGRGHRGCVRSSVAAGGRRNPMSRSPRRPPPEGPGTSHRRGLISRPAPGRSTGTPRRRELLEVPGQQSVRWWGRGATIRWIRAAAFPRSGRIGARRVGGGFGRRGYAARRAGSTFGERADAGRRWAGAVRGGWAPGAGRRVSVYSDLARLLRLRRGRQGQGRGSGGPGEAGIAGPPHAMAGALAPLDLTGHLLLQIAGSAQALAVVDAGLPASRDGTDVVGLADHRIAVRATADGVPPRQE